MYTCTRTYTSTHTCAHIHTYTCTHTQARTHVHLHTHTQAHTCTHTCACRRYTFMLTINSRKGKDPDLFAIPRACESLLGHDADPHERLAINGLRPYPEGFSLSVSCLTLGCPLSLCWRVFFPVFPLGGRTRLIRTGVHSGLCLTSRRAASWLEHRRVFISHIWPAWQLFLKSDS